MTVMKIALFNIPEREREVISNELPSCELFFLEGMVEEKIDEIQECEGISIFVGNPITKEIISKLDHLRLIVTRSTGFDHIDIEAAKEKNITVLNVPSYGERTVAEFAFALIMTLSRKITEAYDRLRRTGDTDIDHFEGFDLVHKKIGIVGLGKIGKNAARIAHGFGMEVYMYDLHPDDNFAQEVSGRYVTLEELVSTCDIVTLHVPYNTHTHHMINAQLLSQFKKGSILINTSRGGVVHTAALLDALKNKTLMGAGLDVVEGEEDFRDDISLLLKRTNDIEKFRDIIIAHELVEMSNVVVTPHIAFNTKEAKEEILHKTIENIKDYMSGNTQANIAL